MSPKTQYITQDTEDSLSLGTLNTLLDHYNFSIRETAAKIICDRASSDQAVFQTLLYGITRPDYDERMKNLRALALITDFSTLDHLHDYKAYACFVRSLELSLEDYKGQQEKLDVRYFDDYYLRDMSEKLCLMFISQLLTKHRARKLVKTGFIERWLAKQYWGDNPDEIVNNFQQYMCFRANRITDIIGQIVQYRGGREALHKAGLISDRSKKIMDHSADGGESDFDPTDRPVGGRLQDYSAEEQRLRHRHREAMVFNDGTTPLNIDDIFERNSTTPWEHAQW